MMNWRKRGHPSYYLSEFKTPTGGYRTNKLDQKIKSDSTFNIGFSFLIVICVNWYSIERMVFLVTHGSQIFYSWIFYDNLI